MKKITIRVLVVLGIIFLIMKGLEWRIESKFEVRLNSNPDRAYNITYSDFDLGTFFKGVTLDEVRIEPLNPGNGTIITGHVDYATINGIVWRELLFGKKLNLDEIAFEQPIFEVTLSADTTKSTSGKGLQVMFGDIISRADLNSFRIQNGSIILKDSDSKDIKGQVKRLNILATEIETDSLKFKNLIPFQVGNLNIDIDSITFKPNDYTDISLGSLHYNLMDKEFLLNDISLGYSIDWVEVSKRAGVQNDIIELNVKEIGIHQLEPSSDFYTKLDIEARKISLDELNIKLQRNKNIPRPPDVVKPLFQGIINSIPMEILIDSIQISNSSVTYNELGVKKSESGSLKIQEINGTITGITNMPKEQINKGHLEAKISASLKGKAPINVELDVPYDKETFSLLVDVGAMGLTNLNSTLKPLAGVEMVTGQMNRIKFQMNAGQLKSQNNMVFDYSNLEVKLLNEKNKDKSKNMGFLSAIANTAIRANNMPGQDKYLVADYQTKRNVARSPINYIVQGLINGFIRIVPGKGVQKMIIKEDKKGKKSKKS
ncbi:DUF748 domain-containing protein [uncultured Eudoraea sp.]|uniref:DUF748 domain-containing protein n=1 Tax=uncultured Eudoraea sp. TaxID=1035614 RepID=UPI0026104505|nr:DUF748 domain-containing protein [uncultured Eudoraea sp.]